MSNNKNNSSIGIYFSGLQIRERATFDRVIAFNVTHGLKAHTCGDSQSAALIIISEEGYSKIETKSEQTVMVVASQPNCDLGDFHVTRPLLITRVMNALADAIKMVEERTTSIEELKDELLDNLHKIEDHEGKSSVVLESSEEQGKVDQSAHHALVIDDSAAIRKQLELELRDAGITAEFADSGELALEKAEQGTFDLIFLDIIMPGIDGYETCKRLRAITEYKKTPIIMLSGKTSPLDEVQGVIAGATTYLTKPVKSAMLQETLARVTKWINNFANTETKKESQSA